MSDRQTSERFPPSVALCKSLWVLAYQRTWATGELPKYCHPASRVFAPLFPTTEEYYRIIDRISAGRAP